MHWLNYYLADKETNTVGLTLGPLQAQDPRQARYNRYYASRRGTDTTQNCIAYIACNIAVWQKTRVAFVLHLLPYYAAINWWCSCGQRTSSFFQLQNTPCVKFILPMFVLLEFGLLCYCDIDICAIEIWNRIYWAIEICAIVLLKFVLVSYSNLYYQWDLYYQQKIPWNLCDQCQTP